MHLQDLLILKYLSKCCEPHKHNPHHIYFIMCNTSTTGMAHHKIHIFYVHIVIGLHIIVCEFVPLYAVSLISFIKI